MVEIWTNHNLSFRFIFGIIFFLETNKIYLQMQKCYWCIFTVFFEVAKGSDLSWLTHDYQPPTKRLITVRINNSSDWISSKYYWLQFNHQNDRFVLYWNMMILCLYFICGILCFKEIVSAVHYSVRDIIWKVYVYNPT